MSHIDPAHASHVPGDHHLARLLSAYVAGQLSVAEVERVESHLVICGECSQAVEEISQVRNALARQPIIDPSDKLLAQLTLIEQVHGRDDERNKQVRRRWPMRVAVAAFGLAASFALLAVLGTYDLPNVSGNVAKRAQNSLLNPGAGSTQFMIAANTFEQAGSLEPELRSLADRTADLEVVAVNRESERDEIEAVVRLEAAQVVVRDRRGKLPSGADVLGQIAEVADLEVQVAAFAPGTAGWQRGDRVLSGAAEAPHDTIAVVGVSFPPVPVDEGIGARVVRGVHKVGQVIG